MADLLEDFLAPQLKYASIAQGSAGTTELVAAVAGKKVKVVSYVFTMSAVGTAKFKGTNDLTGAMDFEKGGAVVQGKTTVPQFETGIGESLSIVTTGGSANGHFSYLQI